MRFRTLCLAILLMAGHAQATPSQSGPATVNGPDAGVQAFFHAWDTAWNAHDVEGMLRLTAEDCVTVNRFGIILTGREEARRQMVRLHTTVFKDAHFPPLRLMHQRLLTPGLVVVQAAWQNPSLKPPPAAPVDDMVITFVLRQSGGGWLAEQVDLHNVETPPGPPKP